jgi:hypothetical protein
MELSGKEEEYLAKMRHEIRTWKASTSEYAYNVQGYIKGIKDEGDFSEKDIELYHAYLQVKERSSIYFRKKFERLVRRQIEEFDGDTESTSYRLAKILESLNPTEAESTVAA